MVEARSLLEAWRAGDADAGREIYRRHVGEMTRFFRNKVPETELQDMVAQTFLGLVESRDRFREQTSFRRFAYAVAQNVLRRHIRTRYKRAREEVDFSSVCIAELDRKTLSSLVSEQRHLQAFVQGLRSVPIDDQILLEMRYFEALSGPEIAQAIGKPEGTVRGRLARAKDRLQKAVQHELERTRHLVAPDFDRWAEALRVTLGRDRAAPPS